jgi:PAS domain-containing protein
MPPSFQTARSPRSVVIPGELTGAWAEALVYQSVLANRPEPLPSHPDQRSIVVPIIDRDEIIGLLAVANRDRDYTGEHLRELEEIANHVGPILHARLVRDRLERERDAFNRALVTSENRYRAIVQQQTEFVARFLPDGTLTFVNEALCRYSGDRAELIGQSLGDPVRRDAPQSQPTSRLSRPTPGRRERDLMDRVPMADPVGQLRQHARFEPGAFVSTSRSGATSPTATSMRWRSSERSPRGRSCSRRSTTG